MYFESRPSRNNWPDELETIVPTAAGMPIALYCDTDSSTVRSTTFDLLHRQGDLPRLCAEGEAPDGHLEVWLLSRPGGRRHGSYLWVDAKTVCTDDAAHLLWQTTLVSVSENGSEQVLDRALSKYNTFYNDSLPHVVAHLTAKAVRNLRLGGSGQSSELSPALRECTEPSRSGLAFGLQRARRWIRERFTVSEWRVGYIQRPAATLLSRPIVESEVCWIANPDKHTYLADPFPDPLDDCAFFAEAYDQLIGKAKIVHVKILSNGTTKTSEALDAEYHLSYPFSVTDDKGSSYIIPESGWGGVLRAHRIRDSHGSVDPDGVTLLADTTAADASVFWFNGYWWLFYTASVPVRDTFLHIWCSDSVLGPWVSHPGNPVKLDVTSSRPAGHPFIHEGTLYRPVQDSSGVYGARMSIMRVTKLTRHEFSEERVVWLGPFSDRKYRYGPHTVSSSGNATFVDAKSRISSVRVVAVRVASRIRKTIARLSPSKRERS